MQVDKSIENQLVKEEEKSSSISNDREMVAQGQKQVKAENRIAKYEQKPERKASKMLVRLLQWADKLIIKFFTKKLLPEQIEIFFNREARANKVQLKKAQIDYSVQDFAVRLYVFWVCHSYFDKELYEPSLQKLLIELRDELTRKKKNLAQSLTTCQGQAQKKQKQEELKWMDAIINGLKHFIARYKVLQSEEQAMQFFIEVTSNIMIECLRKPGNKLLKKKEKLKIKIKYFQQKITQILGSQENKSVHHEKQKKINKLIQKNPVILISGYNPLVGLSKTFSNSSAFQKYKGDQTTKYEENFKKQSKQTQILTPEKAELNLKEQISRLDEVFKSNEKITIPQVEKVGSQSIFGFGNIKMEEQILVKIQQENQVQ